MNPVLIQELGSLLIQAVELGIQYGPALIADIKLTWQLATSGTALTPAQQTQADTVVAAAHAALQAQVKADAITDAVVA